MKNDPELEAYREKAIQLLSDNYAADKLEVEEFERRLDLVHAASSAAAIRNVVSDLPALVHEEEEPPTDWEEGADSPQILSILSERKLTGDWIDGRGARNVTLLASTRLDLRDTSLSTKTVNIDVVAIMGEVKIIVPPDMRVENYLTPVLAEVNVRASRSSEPKRRTLRLTGFALMAEVKIEVKR